MDKLLNNIEIRVLAALIEKEVTTPDYYPLSLNALQSACNQKSNRMPVMNCTEEQIRMALESLKEKHLAWRLSTAGGRVPKYEHNLRSILPLDEAETAVLCTLMLRGAQTAGEIRTRSERMHKFVSIDDVYKTLDTLLNMEKPLVMELERVPGHKENRWIHLMGEEQDEQPGIQLSSSAILSESKSGSEDRITLLEENIEQLRNDLISLKNEFELFKSQF